MEHFETNNLTIERNSQPINGGSVTENAIVTSVNGAISIHLVYVDGTVKVGLIPKMIVQTSQTGESFIILLATGGTITTCGN